MVEDLGTRLDRLDRAWALRAAHEYVELRQLLEPLQVDTLLEDTDLGILLCTAWHRTGEFDRALELVQRLAAPCEVRGNDRLYRERMNLEAIIRIGRCDYAGAEPLSHEVLDASGRAADDLFLAYAYNNLGLIASVRCRFDVAVTYLERSLVHHRRIGHFRGVGANHQNLGLAYRWMGRWREADDHSRRGFQYVRKHGSEDELGYVELERAIFLGDSGDTVLAKALLQRAYERSTRIGHNSLQADVLRVVGILAAREGHVIEARTLFERALQLARETSNRLVEAEVLEEQASLAATLGRRDMAEAKLSEAVGVFVSLGTPERALWCEARIRSAMV
jgi:tetratricopeptide (TPR) repeat protein